MIVNVNPYDTGFDENSHVMKFSALARDVSTTTVKRVPSSIPRLAPHTNRRQVTISTGGKAGTRVTETYLDVLEGDIISLVVLPPHLLSSQRMKNLLTTTIRSLRILWLMPCLNGWKNCVSG